MPEALDTPAGTLLLIWGGYVYFGPPFAAIPLSRTATTYLYRREFLLEYVRMEPTPLELSESLEQLRILENGYRIYLVQVSEDSISVDTPEDLARVEAILAAPPGD